jgi:hypothetical protein
VRQLNEKELIHNHGSDIWDYLFESQPIPRRYDADDSADEWFDDGVSWLMEELLDGEVFEYFEESDRFVYTSMGRHVNLKKRAFRSLTLQGNTIAGNSNGGAFSMSKMVEARWGIKLDYKTLPYECTKWITTTNASKGLRKWIEDNE